MPRSRVAAAALAAVALVVPLAVAAQPAHAAHTARTPHTAPSAGTQWHAAPSSYQARPGQWQRYVLAPKSHLVRPVAVTGSSARGGSIVGDPADLLGNGSSVRLVSTGDRTASPLVTLDFGRDVGGRIAVRVTGASATAPKLHVCFSESREYAAFASGDNNGEAAQAPGCDTANIWNGYPGIPYTYDSDSHLLSFDPSALPATSVDKQLRGGFRYATFFLDGPGSIDLRDVTLHFDAVPAQPNPAAYKGYFLSSDDALNKIWYAGAYTVQLDTWRSNTAKSWPYATGEADHADAQVPGANPSEEVIFDGAKRDRIVWQGDLAVQAPVTYLTTDDVTAVDNSLSSLAGQQQSDGFVPAESLVGQHNRDELRTYGEYVTWFVFNHYEHYLYTGDHAYLARWWPALQKATAWLESVRAQDPNGLIAFGSVGSCGHYGYSDCGHETYVNALYERNLKEMASLAGAVGDRSLATTYRDRADALRTAIVAQLWDPSVGAFRLSREIPNAYPQDANATAVVSGVATPRQAARAMDYLRRTSWSTYGALTVAPSTPNPSISPFYEPLPSGFEAAARLDQNDPSGLAQESSFDLMRTFWGYQLAQDPQSTFPEKLDLSGDPGIKQFTSLAHGWAAAPTTVLTTQVLGVSPTAAGFTGYAVVPHPGDLHWAQGRVPTPHGAITASWQADRNGFALHADAPRGTVGRLAVPTGGVRSRVQLDGRTVWNGNHAVGGSHASSSGGYVFVDGVRAGRHTMTASHLAAIPTQARLVATPSTRTVHPGDTAAVVATLTARAQDRVTGALRADAGDWAVHPASASVDKASGGAPVTVQRTFAVDVPADAPSGQRTVTVTFRTARGTLARASVVLDVAVDRSLYNFEAGTQGWVAGNAVSSVAQVSSFPDGPGHCDQGNGCLDAAGTAAPASTLHTVSVNPSTPLDLSSATTFVASVDGYGGAPGATGYQAVVTLTGAGGDVFTRTVPVSNDAWNHLTLDISGWAARSSVSRIEIGFGATGSDADWTPHFQIDSVGTTG